MMKLKKWIALTTCAAFLAAMPLAGASADGRRGGWGGGWGGGSGGYYGGHGGSGFYGGSHNRSRSYYRGHRGYYGRHDGRRGYRHRGRTGRTVAIGILGLGLGYMLSEASRPRVSQPRPVIYRQPVYRQPAYRRPAPAYRQPVRPAGAQCLQEREYQTRVLIGGEEVDAYGTACLQPDGSWRQGPATVVPEF